MIYTPVVLFVYNRKDKLIKCLESLDNNIDARNTDIYIYADGPKGLADKEQVDEVRNYLDTYYAKSNFKSVTIKKSAYNKGLAESIIFGVTEVIRIAGQVIVVEDDLITAKDFLQYMNGALEYYKDKQKYGSISAYTPNLKALDKYNKDIYVTGKGECWGWGTWENRWKEVDWNVSTFSDYLNNKTKRKEFEKLQYGLDVMLRRQMKGEIDSWAVRWCYYLFENNLLTVYPRKSRVLNKGLDGSGTNCFDQEIDDNNELGLYSSCKYEELEKNEYLSDLSAVAEKPTLYEKIVYFIKQRKRINKL